MCNAHGGKFFVEKGIDRFGPRGYWLLFESMNRLPGGTLFRCAHIHHSWAMRYAARATPKNFLRRSDYSMTYLLKGQGVYYDTNYPEGIEVSAGDLICLFPGCGHAYAPTGNSRWDEITINFEGEVFNSWVGPGLLDPAHPIRRLAPIESWLDRFHRIVLPMAQPDASPSLRDTGALLQLIADMCDRWHTPAKDADTAWIQSAQRSLREVPLGDSPDYEALAKALNVTEQTYRKKFKKLSGRSPSTYRAQFIVEQACHRLLETNGPLKQIAEDLGFGSEYYFSRRFKQIAGYPPGEYRKRIAAV